MRADNTKVKQRWTDEDKDKLRKLHNECSEESKSSTFIENLTNMFGGNRTSASIADECRRLGLQVKRNPKSDNCTEDSCKIQLTDENRVGDTCRRCYNRLWFRKNNKKK